MKKKTYFAPKSHTFEIETGGRIMEGSPEYTTLSEEFEDTENEELRYAPTYRINLWQ